MNIKDAKQEMIHTIKAYTARNESGACAIPPVRQRPVLLIGPPGIGKTAVMEQAAAECGIGFVSYTMTHHTRQSAVGLPFIEHHQFDGRDYAVTEYTMSEILSTVYQCIEETGCREGLLFLDEINCVSETLAPSMLQFLQNKTFGSHRLPEGWILAAAGNPQEYNKSVREFDIATLDRLKYITVEADYDAWRPYALENCIHGAILSYLDTHREQFYILNQTYTVKEFVTARGWEDLSCLLLQYERLDLPVTPALVEQYLHCESLAKDFSGYYQLYLSRKKAVPIAAMIEGNQDAFCSCSRILTESAFDEKLYLVHLMLSYLGIRFHQYEEGQQRLRGTIEVQDRFRRYLGQKNCTSPAEVIATFLEKEHEILAIRQKHGLSSEQEIRNVQEALYDFQKMYYDFRSGQVMDDHTVSEDIVVYFQEEKNRRSLALTQDAGRLCSMLEQCIRFLEQSGGAEFTLFLSSLYQNPLALSFFRYHPCERCEQYRNRLNFKSREEALKEQLTSLLP
ncbi:MAG: AAA family ATPase [Candidatus Choladocola sp.]|nr:AAA family ATPase [Candidatus Choladocola sp.]